MTEKINLHIVINLRGNREQSFKFAVTPFYRNHQYGQWRKSKGKRFMKHCYTRGCKIFTPLFYALKGLEIQNELRYERAFLGETQINSEIKYTF